jgi:alpha-mannosidase
MEFNNPLIARTAAAHSGDLPARWGLLEIASDDVVASALKPGRNGTVVLRVYEAAGKPSLGVRSSWRVPVSEVHEANLIEDTGARIDATHDSFTFDLKPYEIKTFKLTVKPIAQGPGQTAQR